MPGADQRRLQDLFRRHRRTRGAPRARCNPARPSTCSTVSCPGPRRTMRASTCAPCSRASPRCASGRPTAGRAGADCRPPCMSIPGINRLGMSETEVAAAGGRAGSAGHLRDDSGDEPPRLRRRTRQPHERAAARPLQSSCAPASAGAGEPRPTRAAHFSAPASISISCGRASRCTADVRTKTSRTPCARLCASRQASPGARGGCRRNRRLRRHLQSAARLAHRHHRLRLCRRLPACPERCHRRAGPVG